MTIMCHVISFEKITKKIITLFRNLGRIAILVDPLSFKYGLTFYKLVSLYWRIYIKTIVVKIHKKISKVSLPIIVSMLYENCQNIKLLLISWSSTNYVVRIQSHGRFKIEIQANLQNCSAICFILWFNKIRALQKSIVEN